MIGPHQITHSLICKKNKNTRGGDLLFSNSLLGGIQGIS